MLRKAVGVDFTPTFWLRRPVRASSSRADADLMQERTPVASKPTATPPATTSSTEAFLGRALEYLVVIGQEALALLGADRAESQVAGARVDGAP